MLFLTHRFPILRKRKNLRRLTYIGLIVLTWIAFIVPLYFLYIAEGAKFTPATSQPIPPNIRDYVEIRMRLSGLDLQAGTYKLHLDFNPKGNLVRNNTGLLVQPMTMIIGSETKKFSANERMNSLDLNFNFISGDLRIYPYDKHTGNLEIFAASSTNGTLENQVNLNSTLEVEILSFSFRGEFNSTNLQYLTLNFNVGRSATTKVFSVSVIILCWLLSILVGFLAIQTAWRGREVPPPVLGFPALVLFALPSLRNIQPGVPAIGSVSDVIGFFFNMAIVSVSLISMIICYILRWKAPQREEEVIMNLITTMQRKSEREGRESRIFPKRPPTLYTKPDDPNIERVDNGLSVMSSIGQRTDSVRNYDPEIAAYRKNSNADRRNMF
ncbi:hypothetical protein BKA69DRAFT_1172553 [Paraphysoderma sedebokerense]|nr:hypothetical protein BKA69DRAFT_1172553 [Paraphysoderma sedebokerense]